MCKVIPPVTTETFMTVVLWYSFLLLPHVCAYLVLAMAVRRSREPSRERETRKGKCPPFSKGTRGGCVLE